MKYITMALVAVLAVLGGVFFAPAAHAATTAVTLDINCTGGAGGVVEYDVEPVGSTAYLVVGDTTSPDGYAIWEGTITGAGSVDPYADMAGVVSATAYDDANNVVGQASADCSAVTPPPPPVEEDPVLPGGVVDNPGLGDKVPKGLVNNPNLENPGQVPGAEPPGKAKRDFGLAA